MFPNNIYKKSKMTTCCRKICCDHAHFVGKLNPRSPLPQSSRGGPVLLVANVMFPVNLEQNIEFYFLVIFFTTYDTASWRGKAIVLPPLIFMLTRNCRDTCTISHVTHAQVGLIKCNINYNGTGSTPRLSSENKILTNHPYILNIKFSVYAQVIALLSIMLSSELYSCMATLPTDYARSICNWTLTVLELNIQQPGEVVWSKILTAKL